jgi:hypothetical protein
MSVIAERDMPIVQATWDGSDYAIRLPDGSERRAADADALMAMVARELPGTSIRFVPAARPSQEAVPLDTGPDGGFPRPAVPLGSPSRPAAVARRRVPAVGTEPTGPA